MNVVRIIFWKYYSYIDAVHIQFLAKNSGSNDPPYFQFTQKGPIFIDSSILTEVCYNISDTGYPNLNFF